MHSWRVKVTRTGVAWPATRGHRAPCSVTSLTSAQPRRPRTSPEKGSAQSGQSLVEVLISVLLTGMVFLAIAGSMLTVLRSRAFNEKVQSIDSSLVAYGSILQNQVTYVPCINSGGSATADAYFFDADGNYTDTSNGITTKWRRPNNIAVKVVSVRTWDPVSQAWNSGCSASDSGSQLVRYQVTACPTTSTDPACAGGKIRFAEVVKRKPGPS